MQPRPDPDPQERPPHPDVWAKAFMNVGIVLILVLACLFIFNRLMDAPGKAVDKTVALVGRGLDKLARVTDAFRKGTITTTFIGYATEVSGNSYFQFATLHQMEVFERKDEASLAWGKIHLPDVIVEARAPVEYTYFLDLNATWNITVENETVHVRTPPIRFNQPAVDASRIEYRTLKSSLFRRESPVTEKLKQGLTGLSLRRAEENMALVREQGRRQTAAFIRTWLAREFQDGMRYRVVVLFPGETDPEPSGLKRPSRD
ncbi:MAG: hypothetical protein HY360_17790 [Verrucomicrobia bacterium]|nr:hypothetical protein [Verrucomicrobiota bacterium]